MRASSGHNCIFCAFFPFLHDVPGQCSLGVLVIYSSVDYLATVSWNGKQRAKNIIKFSKHHLVKSILHNLMHVHRKSRKYWWAKLYLYFPGALHSWSQHWNSNRRLQEDFILFVPDLCHGQLIVATYTLKGTAVEGDEKAIIIPVYWKSGELQHNRHGNIIGFDPRVSVGLAFSSWLWRGSGL